MSVTSKLASILGAFKTYGATAVQAAGEIETAVGPGNGQTKAALLTSVLLATFHAGEAVPVPTVQLIASIGDLVVNILNSRGQLGKPAADTPAVSVPTL